MTKPRFKKTKRAKIHIGRPIPETGWKPFTKYFLILKGIARSTVLCVGANLVDARRIQKEMLEEGTEWLSAEIVQRDVLHKRAM